MKYASKQDLIGDIEVQHARLREVLEELSPEEYEISGVWGDDWTVKDLVAHLTAWLNLFLGWYRAGISGLVPQLPAPGYKWNETPRLNRSLRAQHEAEDLTTVLGDFAEAHDSAVSLLGDLSPDALLQPGRFGWTGKNPLVTYAAANTASHYRFALRVLKRWRRKRPYNQDRANGE